MRKGERDHLRVGRRARTTRRSPAGAAPALDAPTANAFDANGLACDIEDVDAVVALASEGSDFDAKGLGRAADAAGAAPNENVDALADALAGAPNVNPPARAFALESLANAEIAVVVGADASAPFAVGAPSARRGFAASLALAAPNVNVGASASAGALFASARSRSAKSLANSVNSASMETIASDPRRGRRSVPRRAAVPPLALALVSVVVAATTTRFGIEGNVRSTRARGNTLFTTSDGVARDRVSRAVAVAARDADSLVFCLCIACARASTSLTPSFATRFLFALGHGKSCRQSRAVTSRAVVVAVVASDRARFASPPFASSVSSRALARFPEGRSPLKARSFEANRVVVVVVVVVVDA